MRNVPEVVNERSVLFGSVVAQPRHGSHRSVFLIIGLWGVLTSAFGYCPFNGLFNRNSCEIDLQRNAGGLTEASARSPQLHGSRERPGRP